MTVRLSPSKVGQLWLTPLRWHLRQGPGAACVACPVRSAERSRRSSRRCSISPRHSSSSSCLCSSRWCASIRLSMYLTDPIGRAVKFVGLLQYQRLFSTPDFLNSLQRSVLFVLYTVPTTLVVVHDPGAAGQPAAEAHRHLPHDLLDHDRRVGRDRLADLHVPVPSGAGHAQLHAEPGRASRRCRG